MRMIYQLPAVDLAPPPPSPCISFDWPHSISPPDSGSAPVPSAARAKKRAASGGVEVDPSDYSNHKGIPDARMKELMDEFIRFLRQRSDQAAYIELQGAEWNEEWRRKWEEYCQLKGSCFELV